MKEKVIEALKAILVVAVFLILFGYFSKPAEASTFKPVSSLQNQKPMIAGFLGNEDGGRIMLTTEPADCKSGLFFYATNRGGKIVAKGCYTIIGQEVFATWSDGSMYQYPGSEVQFTQEFLDYQP